MKGNSPKQVIYDKFGTILSESKSILFTNSIVNSALKIFFFFFYKEEFYWENSAKILKKGKACDVDGLAAEHIIYVHSITHVF